MLGMPFDAWVLLFCGVGLGLTLEVTFYRARRRDSGASNRAPASADSLDGGGSAAADEGAP